jgi:AraC-like DNA-binding protein
MCFQKTTYSPKLEFDEDLRLVDTGKQDDTVNSRKTLGAVKISYGYQLFEYETTVPVRDRHSFFGLYYIIDNDLGYQFKDIAIPPGILYKMQYNFLYLPHLNCDFIVRGGAVKTFSLEFPFAYFKIMASTYPILNKMLQDAENGIPCVLSPKSPSATARIHRLIMDIIADFQIGYLNDYSLTSKALEIALLSLAQITQGLNAPEKETNETKIIRVKDMLTGQPGFHWTLSLLADKVDMEIRQLTRLFRKKFEMSVMEYLMEERMKQAVVLLKDTTIPLSEIATMVGYKNLSNFSEAFKKRFNSAPSEFRHGGKLKEN